MKLLAGLLIAASLVLGTIAGVTAYLPPVASIDPANELQLAAPAGVDPDDASAPLLDPADGAVVLTAEVLGQLSDADVTRVRVKSFALNRWSHRYLFLLSGVGLATGGFLLRRENRKHWSVDGGASEKTSPEQLLRDALGRVQALRQSVAESDAAKGRNAIVETIDDLMRKELDAFVESRPLLIGRLGVAGYARLMDRFAAAERQLNRAWSSAADRVMEESVDCLAEGATRLQEALQLLETR